MAWTEWLSCDCEVCTRQRQLKPYAELVNGQYRCIKCDRPYANIMTMLAHVRNTPGHRPMRRRAKTVLPVGGTSPSTVTEVA